MYKFKRRVAVTATAAALAIPRNQLETVKNHYFAVKGAAVTATYFVADESYTLELAVGSHLFEMDGVESISFVTATTATVSYVAR
jgi:hypothetical protein